jgi:hypothetical protein
MILSTSYKFIFSRGIKTASTSLSNELAEKSRPLEKSNFYKGLRQVVPFLKYEYPLCDFRNLPHTPFARAKKIIPTKIYENCTKFGVVREPVSWMVSVYKHWLRKYANENIETASSVKSLEDFIYFRLDNYQPIQALQFIDSYGVLQTDFVGNFHEMDLFANELSSKLNFQVNLKQLNVAPSNQKLQVSAKEKSLIEKACELDYELFNFDNLNEPFVSHNRNQDKILQDKLKIVWQNAGGFAFDPWEFETKNDLDLIRNLK